MFARLVDSSVITQLTVSATQMEALDYGEILRDVGKRSAILDAAEARYRTGRCPPRTWVCSATGLGLGSISASSREARVRPDLRLLKFETTRDAPDQPVISMTDLDLDAGIRSITKSRPGRSAEQTESNQVPVRDPLQAIVGASIQFPGDIRWPYGRPL